ncbi:MAG: GNAT family N-acetyltransferase [Campylobacterota bacterium]|nr:GNAT family N-acetyltransferase [Campylobacterota bacterium]
MSRELYFLRSSEQKIVVDMFKYAHPHKSEELEKYTEFFGFSDKDLGLYALVDGEIAGAIFSRRFSTEEVPTMSVAIVPKYKGEGVGAFMMEQFLQEAGALYDALEIDISQKPKALKFYEKFGFKKESEGFLLRKELEKKEIVRPSDGYDPSYWMD